MEEKRAAFFTGLIVVIILFLIVGIIFTLVRTFQSRQVVSNTNVPSSVSSPTSSQSNIQTNVQTRSGVLGVGGVYGSEYKSYGSRGFTLYYPKNWGILRCNNSLNFEFDPYNSSDQLMTCDFAIKPITVIYGGNVDSCSGDLISISSLKVKKSKVLTNGGENYRWCTQTNPVLDITHRVSSSGGTATSKDDFSGQIEQIISRLVFGGGS